MIPVPNIPEREYNAAKIAKESQSGRAGLQAVSTATSLEGKKNTEDDDTEEEDTEEYPKERPTSGNARSGKLQYVR